MATVIKYVRKRDFRGVYYTTKKINREVWRWEVSNPFTHEVFIGDSLSEEDAINTCRRVIDSFRVDGTPPEDWVNFVVENNLYANSTS